MSLAASEDPATPMGNVSANLTLKERSVRPAKADSTTSPLVKVRVRLKQSKLIVARLGLTRLAAGGYN